MNLNNTGYKNADASGMSDPGSNPAKSTYILFYVN